MKHWALLVHHIRQELDTMLEAGNWAPTHQKTEPWRYIVFSGSESIMTYLDYLDDYYNNCEELSETEAAKFRNKMSGARNTWVTNASAVIVIGQAELFLEISSKATLVHASLEEIADILFNFF